MPSNLYQANSAPFRAMLTKIPPDALNSARGDPIMPYDHEAGETRARIVQLVWAYIRHKRLHREGRLRPDAELRSFLRCACPQGTAAYRSSCVIASVNANVVRVPY